MVIQHYQINNYDACIYAYFFNFIQLLLTTWVTARKTLETGASKTVPSATEKSSISTRSTALESY